MPHEIRLFEDVLFGSEEVRFDDPAPRALYVSAGGVSVNGEEVPADGGVVLAGPVRLCAGASGAAIWRWEVVPANEGPGAYGHRATLRLSGRIDPAAIAE